MRYRTATAYRTAEFFKVYTVPHTAYRQLFAPKLPALQPGLEKLSLEGFRGGEDYYGNVTRPVVGDLNLQYRHAYFVLLLAYSVHNT
jgi:hypothetical protein